MITLIANSGRIIMIALVILSTLRISSTTADQQIYLKVCLLRAYDRILEVAECIGKRALRWLDSPLRKSISVAVNEEAELFLYSAEFLIRIH